MSGADRELVVRLGKFLVVGGTGFAVNSAILFTLYQLLRFPLVIASFVAVTVAICNNFLWNDRWTFDQHHSPDSPLTGRLARFGLVSLGSLVLSSLALWTLVTYAGVHYLLANLIAIGAGSASNFIVNSRWTYRQVGAP
jgi:dolichol-phosphate mannosyltransferase